MSGFGGTAGLTRAIDRLTRQVNRLNKELNRRTPGGRNWQKTKTRLDKERHALTETLRHYRLAGGADEKLIRNAELALAKRGKGE